MNDDDDSQPSPSSSTNIILSSSHSSARRSFNSLPTPSQHVLSIRQQTSVRSTTLKNVSTRRNIVARHDTPKPLSRVFIPQLRRPMHRLPTFDSEPNVLRPANPAVLHPRYTSFRQEKSVRSVIRGNIKPPLRNMVPQIPTMRPLFFSYPPDHDTQPNVMRPVNSRISCPAYTSGYQQTNVRSAIRGNISTRLVTPRPLLRSFIPQVRTMRPFIMHRPPAHDINPNVLRPINQTDLRPATSAKRAPKGRSSPEIIYLD
jgi:hypothetical protein